MLWCSVISCWLTVAQAFAPSPIRWAGRSAEKFVLATRTPPSAFFTAGPLRELTLLDQGHSQDIPSFAYRPDETIILDGTGLCIEARSPKSGDAVRVNKCTGERNQQWSVIPSGHGHKSRIQLKHDPGMCIDVDTQRGSGALVELGQCENQFTASWEFEETVEIAPRLAFSGNVRHAVAPILSITAVVALSLSVWLWRLRQSARPLGGMPLDVDQGGVCMIEAPVEQTTVPAVMALNHVDVLSSESLAHLQFKHVSRSEALKSFFNLFVAGSLTSTMQGVKPAEAVEQVVKTGENVNNLQQISPDTMGSLGAGTMATRSRPETGVVLVSEVLESGDKNRPTVSADAVCDGGVVATINFDSEYPLVRGMFYDVESKARSNEGAFVQVASLPSGEGIADVPKSFFSKAIVKKSGRFGAYGAPTDVKILKSPKSTDSTSKEPSRLIELTFSVSTPGGAEVARHALIAALQPSGSTDAVMLVCSASEAQWKSAEPSLRKMASSFRIGTTRPTKLKRTPAADFRFEERGGLIAKATDTNAEF